MGAPAFIVRFEIETSPVLVLDTLNDSERARLLDWINQHDEWVELLARAQQLADERRVA